MPYELGRKWEIYFPEGRLSAPTLTEDSLFIGQGVGNGPGASTINKYNLDGELVAKSDPLEGMYWAPSILVNNEGTSYAHSGPFYGLHLLSQDFEHLSTTELLATSAKLTELNDGSHIVTGYASNNSVGAITNRDDLNVFGADSYGSQTGFIQRLSANEEDNWIRLLGAENYRSGNTTHGSSCQIFDAIEGHDGSIYVAGAVTPFEGNFYGEEAIYKSEEGIINKDALGNTDIFLAKLDRDGEIDWVRLLGSKNNDGFGDIDIAPNGDILVAGMSSVLVSDLDDNKGLYLARVSPQGGTVWEQWYEDMVQPSIKVFDDGSIHMITATPRKTHLSYADGFLYHLDAAGELENSYQFPGNWIYLTGFLGGVISNSGQEFYLNSNYSRNGGITTRLAKFALMQRPEDISLSMSSVAEDHAVDSVLADLAVVDNDEDDSHTFRLNWGEGSDDNSKVYIEGNQLKLREQLNREQDEALDIRIEVVDSGQLTYSKAFTISVTDANDLPTGLPVLSADEFLVGQQITVDPGLINDEDVIATDFRYSWQVLDQDSKAWVDIEADDDTDDNNQLIIQSAFIGEKIRGVVGFTDGKGVDESVTSLPVEIQPILPKAAFAGEQLVDQIVSIDTSAIVNAEANTDWIASFSYDWQVSTNDGTSWEILNTLDATDDDNKLKLTSDEVSKLVRGRITYQDPDGVQRILYTEESQAIPHIFEISLIGSPNIGEALAIDISGIPEMLEIERLGWQIKGPEGSKQLDTGDLRWRLDSSPVSLTYAVDFREEPVKEISLVLPDERENVDDVIDQLYGPIIFNHDGEQIEAMFGHGSMHSTDALNIINQAKYGLWEPSSLSGAIHGGVLKDSSLPARWVSSSEAPIAIFAPLDRLSEASIEFSHAPELLLDQSTFVDLKTTPNERGYDISASDLGFYIRGYVETQDENGFSSRVFSAPVLIGDPLTTEKASAEAGGNNTPVDISAGYNPNNAPQGDLLITGEPERGKTISLNTSSITDEDGINTDIGFTHSWQVYDIDSSSWLNLDTTDATDGDKSLTLTTGLIDLELRGRSAYTDGAGLTQSVTSDPVTVRKALPPVLEGAKTQTVYSDFDTISYAPGSAVRVPLLYDTGNNDSRLSGLTLNVHYDSSVLTAIGDAVSSQIDAPISSAQVFDDSQDLDDDPSTDKLIELIWGSFDSSFPDTELPAAVATVEFKASNRKSDPLTGEPMSTQIITTATETAIDYEFISTTTILEATPFNLDVDGDGRVTALGDGLMVIRKLFGAAFSGDALTHKARSQHANRSTEEIHNFIQVGIDSLALDVDNDGQVTALGDGLMIIRRLFGAAFSGSALTNQAISLDSDFRGQANPWESVANNIDALRPDS